MTAYNNIVHNNKMIMEAISKGTEKLGLIINEDETMQSACMMIYGKVIVASGLIKSLTCKRRSRVLGATNDQFPNIGSIQSSVVTNCLTVCHSSDKCFEAVDHYNWLSQFSRLLVEEYNPALRRGVVEVRDMKGPDRIRYIIRATYLDPSLGGVAGVSLTRFVIRRFPDPITEGLAFWKVVHDNTSDLGIKTIAKECGNPRILGYRSIHFAKLLENPAGLNLPRGISVLTVIQREIRKALRAAGPKIRNTILRDAIKDGDDTAPALLKFLESVKECFPRFLSDFYAGTYMGVVKSLMGLFENSRTIKGRFANKVGKRLAPIVVRAELSSILALTGASSRKECPIWTCSSTHNGKGLWEYFLRSATGETACCIVKGPDGGKCGHILSLGNNKTTTSLHYHALRRHKVKILKTFMQL